MTKPGPLVRERVALGLEDAKTKFCPDCQTEFVYYSNEPERCKPCAILHKKQFSADYQIRWRAKKIAERLPKLMDCPDCGRRFQFFRRTPQRCPECAAEHKQTYKNGWNVLNRSEGFGASVEVSKQHYLMIKAFLASNVCSWCGDRATVRDHALPVAMARIFGYDDVEEPWNWNPMCCQCHKLKTYRYDVRDIARLRKEVLGGCIQTS